MKKHTLAYLRNIFFATILFVTSIIPVYAANSNSPINVQAVAGDRVITVSFISQYSGVKGYSFQVICAEQPRETSGVKATGTNSPIKVTATNGTAYKCTVTANGPSGFLGTSDKTDIVVPGSGTGTSTDIPLAPQGVSATPGNGNASITWGAVLGNVLSPTISYTVAFDQYGNGAHVIPVVSGQTAYTHIYMPLNNGTSYTFYVKATNVNGSSSWVSTGKVIPADSTTTTTTGTGNGGTTTTTSGTANGTTNSKIDFAIKNPLGSSSTDLPGFVANVLSAIVDLLFPVVVIMLLYSGFLFVIARGNSEKLGDAKNALLYTLIGAAIVLGASGLAHVIQNTISALAG